MKRKIKSYSIKNIRKAPSKRRWLLFTIIAVVVLAAVAGSWQLLRTKHASNKKPAPSPTINYNPPTKEEKASGNAQKDNAQASDKPAPVPTVNNKRAVTPVISYAKQNGPNVEVDAYVGGVAEDGGTCTLTAALNSTTITKQAPGILNASTTNCPAFNVARSEFPAAGTWIVKVSYKSSTAEGTSAATNLEIK